PVPGFGAPAESSAVDASGVPVPGDAAPVDAGAALAAAPAPEAAPVAPPPAAGGKKKALVFGALAGLVALAAVAVLAPRFMKKPAKPAPPVPEGLSDNAPLPTPAPAPATGTPGGPAESIPAPMAAPQADPRQEAIDAAKGFLLPDGRTLGQALETLSPPVGNLPPWMAEPLPTGRAVVNYFAHGAPGSPTVAYEFEVDPAAKAVVGRNAAAKAVLAGKAAPPPAPPKPKAVKVKAKKAAAKPAPAPKAEESLDSLLGEPGEKPEAKPAAAPKAAVEPADDAPVAPGEEAAPAPKPTAAKRAAKAKPAPAKPAAKAPTKADDEALLDDLLKE
ncbi:MAG: hypothetical protein HY079_14475, partial [Elusimicrobia bacterium]|nr:hypothetical protein [Elusimicrobiota bacterium]